MRRIFLNANFSAIIISKEDLMRKVFSSWKMLSLFLTLATTVAFSNIIYLDVDGRTPNAALHSIEDCIQTDEIYFHNFGKFPKWKKLLKKNQSLVCGNFRLEGLPKKTKLKKPILILMALDPIERALTIAKQTINENGEKGINPLHLEANPICKMLTSNPKLKGTEMFLDCIQNCKKFDLILLPNEKDLYQTALEKLRKKLSLKESGSFSNKTSRLLKNESSSEMIQKLKEKNEFDIALYQYLKKHSDDYSIKKRVVSSKAYKNLQKPKKHVHYTFDMPLIGKGFSERKYKKTGSFYYRYIKEKAEMMFSLKPGEQYRLLFRAKTKKENDFPKITVCGKAVYPRMIEKGNYSLYQLYFKKHKKRKEETKLVFETKGGIFLKEIDISHVSI